MTDAPDLARRFLALWEDYLTAILSNPSEVAALQRWIKAASAFAWDPVPWRRTAGEQAPQPGSPTDAPPSVGASGERDDVVGELARRLARLEERVAAVESRGRAAPRPRRGNRRVRAR